MEYMGEMTVCMTAAGRAKHEKGVPGYANWAVSLDDLIQWLGVWIYMLAFSSPGGDRSSYWVEPWNGFAHRCRLSEFLALGKNGAGVKGRK
eukprot:5599016-Pleurochrysis_carterae.AAC.1